MMPGGGYLGALIGVFVIGLMTSAAAAAMGAGAGLAAGILLGTLTAAAGTISWWVLLGLTFGKSGSAFMGGVFGGLALRMVLYGVAIVATALMDSLHTAALLATLFASHVAYQIIEVAALHQARNSASSTSGQQSAMVAGLLVAGLLVMPALAPAATADAAQAEHGAAGEDAAHPSDDAATHDEGGHGDEEHAEGFDLLHHIVNGNELETPFGIVHLPTGWVIGGIDFSPTKHVVWMWIAALVAMIVCLFGVSQVGLVSRGVGNVLEALVGYVRDEIAGKNIHTNPERFTPYLCTLFVFILFCNLAGLVPFGATATSNLNVTGGLALLSLLLIQAAGIRNNGIGGHLKALCPIPEGIPGWILPLYVPIIIVVELVGIVAKPIALTLRLFANMVAGHVVILSLLGLIFILQTIYVAPASVAFALFIYCLEIFVAFIQAYIFTMLTALFIGMSQHPAH
jgi:F-type H+-transporting ATPase subunit a